MPRQTPLQKALAKQTPMQRAIRELFEIAACDASAEQLLAVANKYDVPVHSLEGLYLDAVDRQADL